MGHAARLRKIPRFCPPLWLAVAATVWLTPLEAFAQLDALCRREAERYDALLALKRDVSPEMVADAYVSTFSRKGADMHAQEVWRRMKEHRRSAAAAIEEHLARIARDWPADELPAIRTAVETQVRDMARIRDLVSAFEAAAITPRVAAAYMERSWRAQQLSLAEPIDHYVQMIHRLAAAHEAKGVDTEQAALRAAADARAAVERARGVAARAIIGPTSPCYKGDLHRLEIALRHDALITTRGAETNPEAIAAAKRRGMNPDRLSPLTYYTHLSFGPRDYSLDRLAAWQVAARSGGGGAR